MKRVTLTFVLALIPVALFAQREAIPALAVISGPGFMTSLIAGIILAFGFQLILMNLSAALGLSVLHTGIEKAGKGLGSVHVGDRKGAGTVKVGEKPGQSSGSMESTARMLNTGFGVWAIVTASISLFFASWLAVKLGTAFTVFSGLILGLAIWGVFYLISSALEMAAMSSMVGSLMSLVKSGFRTVGQAASDLFQPSPEKKAADTARQITDAVRQEIFGDVNMRKTIQEYITQLKPDYQKIRGELTAILNNAQIDIKAMPEQHSATAWVHTGTAAPAAGEVKGAAREAAGTISAEARSDKDAAEKIADTMMELAGMSRQEAEDYRHRVENYLASTGKKELNPEGITRDIDKLVSGNPQEGVNGILARLNDIDRSTITSILAQRKDMNRDEARRVVDMVAGTVNSLRSRYEETKKTAETSLAGGAQAAQGSIEASMRTYLDSLDNPELHYDNIVSDFQTLLHDPRAGAESLIHVLETIDRGDLKQMIAHSGMNVSEGDIDRTIERIENARDSLIRRAEQVREEVETRVQAAGLEGLSRADEVRRVAASAAWWVFGAALISGIASAVGGLVGIMY